MKNTKFDHVAIEAKWQKMWEEHGVYRPHLDRAKRPFFNLMMFPYPSAEGLHVGNMYAFTGADIYGRFKRMQGNDVFEPIGLDGFGIHSENFAIKVGRHPKEQAKISEKNFYRQLRATGNGYDWSRTVETYDPDYYKWTQWIFIQLFKKGLAYRKKAAVNFCPKDKTVLADEQVIDGKCERDGAVVEKRELEQWFFKITAYADRLLAGLDKIDWTEKVKIAQRNWIGKSEGALIKFMIQDSTLNIEVFTTAIDTIFGVTFMALSPEHPLVSQPQFRNEKEIMNYVRTALAKKPKQRMEVGKEKSGVDTGYNAINPFTGDAVPIWIADYVLMEYGTGAVMGVPGHDARDHEFALIYKLPVKAVIKPTVQAIDKASVGPDGFWDYPEIKIDFADQSELFDSGEFNGLASRGAKNKMVDYIEKHGFGKREVHYHLRDWLISRQRYWGPPIPTIYCETCASNKRAFQTAPLRTVVKEDDNIGQMYGWFPVPEDQLPLLLPDVKDWKPKGTGKSPLASVESFVNTTCPNCEGKAVRETDVSDTFLDSSWYFFRYISTEYNDRPWDKERAKKWLPVSMYIGGAEHAVLHLLYTRFLTMVFHDLKLTDFDEPFPRFYVHGLLIKEGGKMSKSKGNIVVPDDYIRKYGADTLRTYLMFLGPFSQGGDFYDSSIGGVYRFLGRVYKLFNDVRRQGSSASHGGMHDERELERKLHQTIKKVTEDMESLRFNTTVAALMELLNTFQKYQTSLQEKHIEQFLLMLAPFAPHIAEELWQVLRDRRLPHVANGARQPLLVGQSIEPSSLNERRSLKAILYSDEKTGSAFNAFASRQSPLAYDSIHTQRWPSYDPKLLVKEEITIVVQVDGKVRDTLRLRSGQASQKTITAAAVSRNGGKVKRQKSIEELAYKSERVKRHLEGKTVRNVIYVAGKILNFVTR